MCDLRLRGGREGDVEAVGQRDGLEDGAQFVKAIGPLVEHAQVEIELGERPEARRA